VNPSSSVTFKNFEIKWSDGKVGIGDYKSLQVSLIPWTKYWNLVNRSIFCSAGGTLALNEAAGVPVFNVGTEQEATFPITMTDKHLLTVTNCGERSGATFTKGDIIVKQPHGYLPGNKIWTMYWLGWFTLIKAFVCVMWVVASARHYKDLVFIHKMIAACALLAFMEAATGYLHYREWNRTGKDHDTLSATMMFFYSLKYTSTLRMLLESAAGAGVIMEKLEVRGQMNMTLACGLFLVTQWAWKATMDVKYRLPFSPTFYLAISIPGTVIWAALFIWVYRQFRMLLLQLQDKELASEAVTLFINTRLVLVGSILLSTVVLLIQVADMMLSATPWNLQWVPYDAAPHSVYTLFLLAWMILWWPNAESWKLGYSEPVSQEEEETLGDGKVQAEQVGIAETEVL